MGLYATQTNTRRDLKFIHFANENVDESVRTRVRLNFNSCFSNGNTLILRAEKKCIKRKVWIDLCQMSKHKPK